MGIELILVMGLPAEETVKKSWKLGVASAAMVALGYPGEIQDGPGARWQWWSFAMVPFLYVVAELAIGLSAASEKQPESLADHHLLVDLSLRVHHQDDRDLWCGGNIWGADRIFGSRRRSQGSIWSPDLGHRFREVSA